MAKKKFERWERFVETDPEMFSFGEVEPEHIIVGPEYSPGNLTSVQMERIQVAIVLKQPLGKLTKDERAFADRIIEGKKELDKQGIIMDISGDWTAWAL